MPQNLLGLSTQVSGEGGFSLTDGPESKRWVIGKNHDSTSEHHASKYGCGLAGRAGLVIQAFRHLGKEHITFRPRRIV